MAGATGTHRGVGWRGTSPRPPKGQEGPAPSAPRLCQWWGACGAASTSVLSSTPSQQPHQCQASASCRDTGGFKQVPASGAATPGLLMDSSPCVHTHRGIPSPPAHVPGGQLCSRTPVHTRSPLPGQGGARAGAGQRLPQPGTIPCPLGTRLGLLEGAIPLLSGTHAPGGPGTEQGLATGQQAKGQGGGTAKGGAGGTAGPWHQRAAGRCPYPAAPRASL